PPAAVARVEGRAGVGEAGRGAPVGEKQHEGRVPEDLDPVAGRGGRDQLVGEPAFVGEGEIPELETRGRLVIGEAEIAPQKRAVLRPERSLDSGEDAKRGDRGRERGESRPRGDPAGERARQGGARETERQ